VTKGSITPKLFAEGMVAPIHIVWDSNVYSPLLFANQKKKML